MTVQELIDELMKIDDKTKDVWVSENYEDDCLEFIREYNGYPNRVYLY